MVASAISVYLSSTWQDLVDERARLMEQLRRIDGVRYVGMEEFGSRPDTPAQASVMLIDQCRYYILIVAGRYGSGITQQEYARALECGLECLVYFYRGGTTGDREDGGKLDEFRRVLQKNHIVTELGDVENLVAKVVVDLTNALRASDGAGLPERIAQLPCLVDRDPRAHKIESITKDLLTEKGPPPTAFVVPGTVADDHVGLVRRFQWFQLPSLFRDYRGHPPLLDAFTVLPWPDLEGEPAEARMGVMRSELNRSLSLHPDAPAVETHEALRNLGKTKIFVSCIPVSRWRRDEPLLIEAWLQFWREARRSGDAFPVVFVCLQFDEKVPRRFLSSLLGSPATRAQKWMEAVAAQHADVHVLPRLTAIALHQVHDWAERRCPQERKDLDVQILTYEVARVYEGKVELRMDELLGPLRTALERAWTARRSLSP